MGGSGSGEGWRRPGYTQHRPGACPQETGGSRDEVSPAPLVSICLPGDHP